MTKLKIHAKHPIFDREGRFVGVVEIKVWNVPKEKCYPEGYKYSLVFALYDEKNDTFDGDFLRYDNHRCEGHHKHIKRQRFKYEFKDMETLLEDFERDLKTLLEEVQR